MKRLTTTSITALLLTFTLAGCATNPAAQHSRHHSDRSVSATPPAQGMKGDMTDMCAMHEKMMNAKSPEERKALMADHMRAMSPEMRQKHMQMMQEQMQMMQEHMGGSMQPRQ